jgi:hypothetical protein
MVREAGRRRGEFLSRRGKSGGSASAAAVEREAQAVPRDLLPRRRKLKLAFCAATARPHPDPQLVRAAGRPSVHVGPGYGGNVLPRPSLS